MTTKNQLDRFKDAARELECDDDPERFAERVRKIANAPPAPHSKKKSETAPLNPLPRSEWVALKDGDGMVAVSTQERAGYRYWEMVEESDLPDGLAVSDD